MPKASSFLRHEIAEHAWNFILVDNTKYLIDSSLGIGYCNDNSFYKEYTNLYFGTKPEILIKSHFPQDKEFLLLDKNITKYEWEHIVFRDRYFYLYGLIDIYPEDEYIYLKKEDKITIRYDTANSDISVIGQIYYRERFSDWFILNKVTYKNGIAEISLKDSNKIYNPIRLEIYVGKKKNLATSK